MDCSEINFNILTASESIISPSGQITLKSFPNVHFH